MSKTKVLFVCLGNICRSPAAEAVFQKLINSQELSDKFIIDSAGTSGYHEGSKADPRMIEAGLKRGIELTSLSRQFIIKDFMRFDHIIVMDDSNYENILLKDTNQEFTHKISKMTDYCSKSYKDYDKIPDPYYGGEEGFNLVLDLLDDACRGLLERL